MIAKLDIKKCPFHKETTMTHYNLSGNGNAVVNTIHSESFLECKEGECMAWDSKARDCRLMMRDTKEEKK